MNVFIVEDSAVMLKDLQSMMSNIPGVKVVGHAVDESGAIEHIGALHPDVVTLDIRLQSGSGFVVLENIKEHFAWIKVMVLTNCSDRVYVNRCKRAGADHFFDKSFQLLQFREVMRECAYRFGSKPGRNKPCLCGSGKKFRKCCQKESKLNPPVPKCFGIGVVPTTKEYDQLVALLNSGCHTELEIQARLLVEQHPDFGFAWKALGASLQMQGKDALSALQKTAELLPDDAEAHCKLGKALCGVGQFEGAKDSYQRALIIKPDYAEAINNLALFPSEQGRFSEAEISLRQALEIKPNYIETRCKMLNTFSRLSDTKTISVTIDDGPNPETTPLLLNVLARYQARANFFVCGKNVVNHPGLAKLIVDSGHGLFSHGFSHRNFTTLTDEEIIEELDRTERLLSEFRPTPTPYLIRLPYGRGSGEPRVNAAVARWRKDAAFIQWGLSPTEWKFVGNCQTPIDVSSHCEEAVQELSKATWGGEIILLHDWPTVIENGNPDISGLRSFFCAVLLEKTLIAIKNKNLNYAHL